MIIKHFFWQIMASQFADKLRLEGVTADEERRCREAFATLPEYVQKAITDAGVVFKVSREVFSHFDGEKIIFAAKHLKDADPITLPAIFFGYGLAQAVKPHISDAVLREAATYQFNSILIVRSGQTNPGKYHIHLTPEQRPAYEEALQKYLNEDRRMLLGEVLEGAYGGLRREREVSSQYKLVYDAYINAAKSNALKESALQATDIAFAINEETGALSNVQREYFEHVNKLVTLLGVTPTEFNTEFEKSLARQILFSTVTATAIPLEENTMGGEKPHRILAQDVLPNYSGRFGSQNWAVPSASGKYKRGFTGKLVAKQQGPLQKEEDTPLAKALTQAKKEMFERTVGAFNFDAQISQSLQANINRLYSEFDIKIPKEYLDSATDASNHPILQLLTSGILPLDRFFQPIEPMKWAGLTITPQNPAGFINAAIMHATQVLADEKHIADDKLPAIIDEMKALHKLLPACAISPDEELAAKQYEAIREKERLEAESAAEVRQKEEARKAVEKAEENKRRAEELAKQPKPYALPESITRHSNIAWIAEELKPLAQLLDRRQPAFKKLGDALFDSYIAQIIDAQAKSQFGVVKGLLDSDKNPNHAAALQKAKKAVEALFARPAEQVPAAEVEATKQIKKHLLNSPVFLSLLLGKQAMMDESISWRDAGEANLFVMDERSGLLRQHWPELAAILLPPLPPPEPKREEPPSPTPSVDPIETLAPVVAVAPIVSVAATPPVTPPPEPIITDEMRAKRRHQEAFDAARQAALVEADMHLYRAIDTHNRFECAIDLSQPHLPIRLKFFNAEGEPLLDPPTIVKEYAQEFSRRGLTMTLEDAVDIKIAVQSMILNEKGIEPMYELNKKGEYGVKMDQCIPNDAYAASKRKISIEPSGGTLSLGIKARNYDHRPFINVSIPLGLPEEPQNFPTHEEYAWINGGKKPDSVSETVARVKVIMDFIDKCANTKIKIDGRAVATRITKRDVSMVLRDYITKNNKEWVERENFHLPGYSEAQLLHTVTDAEGNPVQAITLSPLTLHMDPGGDNPSWHLNFSIHANNNLKDNTQGKYICGWSMNLHTSSKELALARAKESMEGVTTAQGHVMGFMEMIKSYATAHPHDHWIRVGPEDSRGEGRIGTERIQYFMDDALRYEHDIGVQFIKSPPRDGKITLTLQAVRAISSDKQRQAKPDPRVICIKDKQKNRQPIQISLIIPERMVGNIDAFVRKVEDVMRYHAEEHYLSIGISDIAQREDKRKSVHHKYRAITAKNRLERAIESYCHEYFGKECSIQAESISNSIGSFQDRIAATGNNMQLGID